MTLKDRILFYAFRKPVPVTLRELYQFGDNPSPKTLTLIAQFLQKELPVRFAQRLRDLKRLPFGLAETPSMQEVRKCYVTSFKALDEHPAVITEEDEHSFSQMIAHIKGNHKQIQHHIHNSVQELILASKENRDNLDLSRVLDSFYMSRLSIRMLTGQYMALQELDDGMIGMIEVQCSPSQRAHKAADKAAKLCKLHYGRAPEVEVVGNKEIGFSYIPSHLEYIFVELLKNSMRAVCEHHRDAHQLPPITVAIAEGDDDVSIRVSDRGGGIARDGMKRIWTYAYTTANTEDVTPDSIAGFGDGLPTARLYARYFGGDLKVMSMQGFGTDAFLHIHRLGNVDEQLPY
eukprot:TRINITY_DN20111_c0_g1_i4.p1 TRINITY_DN20111_c0_g1~~TRINITY_DN20111_c0_g1_i4.p1  ORF type:complete len:346 (+),score=96.65 TRINITY_DN20111_c0_g1_i4:192-1229(+)